jgi:hypothetical protein
MLDEVCALLFQPNLLIDEFERLQRDGDKSQTPIRDAFRHLMEMAGKKRRWNSSGDDVDCIWFDY